MIGADGSMRILCRHDRDEAKAVSPAVLRLVGAHLGAPLGVVSPIAAATAVGDARVARSAAAAAGERSDI